MKEESGERELIIGESLIDDGRTVVLGISGGPDSVCLLCEISALSAARRAAGGKGNPIVCAHVNHGLRGDESDGDEVFVTGLCERYGASCEIKRVDAVFFRGGLRAAGRRIANGRHARAILHVGQRKMHQARPDAYRAGARQANSNHIILHNRRSN